MAGRKRKYQTEVLESIINEFFNKNNVFGQISATDLANFASYELGYKDIKYFHFTRDKQIKKIIDELNNSYEITKFKEKNIYLEFNPDKFLKTYENDKKTQKIILRNFADSYNELVRIQHLKNQCDIEINELKNENIKLKTKLKELANKIDILKIKNKNLSKFQNLENELIMRKYLKEEGLLEGIDDENLTMILNKCKFEDEKITEIRPDILKKIKEDKKIVNEEVNDIIEIDRLMNEIDLL